MSTPGLGTSSKLVSAGDPTGGESGPATTTTSSPSPSSMREETEMKTGVSVPVLYVLISHRSISPPTCEYLYDSCVEDGSNGLNFVILLVCPGLLYPVFGNGPT